MSRARAGQGGFTLVEVMLAVAVLALAMVALGQTLGASAVAYRDIDDTRRAYLVAADKLVEMQVYQQWPNTGTNDEEVTRGEQNWWIETKISAGPYPDTRRVDIDVGPMVDDHKQPLAYSLASLIGKPAEDTGRAPGSGANGDGAPPSNEDLTGK